MMEDDTLDDDVQVKITRQNAFVTGEGGESNRVADPDRDSIGSVDLDPDPGGQK
jgi:hypothetical protein